MESYLMRIRDALLSVTDKVSHYEALLEEDQYIVWKESNDTGQWADNAFKEKVIAGTIEYFTTVEFDQNIERIEEALHGAATSYWLNFIRHDTVTKQIQYEWGWQI